MANHKYCWLLVIGLTVIAALPRFYELGSLSFYGDEETSSFPARAFAEGNGAVMPSGMSYRRALPHTWLNALSARIWGLDRELSYRIPSAVLGTLSIPLLFLLARPFVGWAVALVAATFLSFSEWHIATSREARMYAPFLFFYIASGFTIWRWAITNSWLYLLAAFLLFALTVSFHTLGLIASIFSLIPIFVMGWAKVPSYRLVFFTIISSITAWLYSNRYVQAAFNEWIANGGVASTTSDEGSKNAFLQGILSLPVITLTATLAGAGIGIWAAHLNRTEDLADGASLRTLGRYILGALAGGLAFAGQLYGAAIAGFLFLLIYAQGLVPTVYKILLPASIIIIGALVQASTSIIEQGLINGIKQLLMFPFPYPFFLAKLIPGVLVLFLGMGVYLVLIPQRADDRIIRASILAVMVPIVAVGLVSKWEGMRYLIESYPFLLLVAAAGLLRALELIGGRIGLPGYFAIYAAVGLAVSGLLGGHGIPQALKIATLKHGEYTLASSYPFYPDHQGPGRYVAQHRNGTDIVIAEDALEQKWYVGHVDYWLRDYETHRGYLYKAQDGYLRDIYVNSRLATADILDTLPQSGCRYIWLITSGEMAHKLNYYLDSMQRGWLESIEQSRKPIFVGRDGVTKVYRLDCYDEDKRKLNE